MSCDWNTGLAVLVFGLIAHIIGFASPYWILDKGVDDGLWMKCDGTGCISFLNKESELTGWFHAVQALALGGLVAAILAFFTSVLYIKIQNTSLALAPGLLSFTAGMLIGTSLLVYAVKELDFTNSLGWAFYVECGSVASLVISCVILFIAAARTKRKSQVVTLSVRRHSSIELQPTTEL